MQHAAMRRPIELPFFDLIAEVGNPRLISNFVGPEIIGGRTANHFLLRLPDATPDKRFLRRPLNEEVEFFADAATGLIVRSRRMQAADNDVDFRVPSIFDFSDYRQVGSVKMPFRIVNTIGNESSGISLVTIVIESVLVNQGLADSVFQPPVR